jgi:hypothetical protein
MPVTGAGGPIWCWYRHLDNQHTLVPPHYCWHEGIQIINELEKVLYISLSMYVEAMEDLT